MKQSVLNKQGKVGVKILLRYTDMAIFVLRCFILTHPVEFWHFSWSLLCYTLVSVLVLGIGIARGQYYWILDIGCLSWYRSNPKYN